MYKKLFLLSFLVLTLIGCNKKTMSNLGLRKGAPDEFSIIPNQPLTVPPMFELKDPNLLNSNTETKNTKEGNNANNNSLSKEDKQFLNKLDSQKPFKVEKDGDK